MKLPAIPQDGIFDKRTGYHKAMALCDAEIRARDQRQKEFITKTRNYEDTKLFVSFRAFSLSCFAAIRLEKRRDYSFKTASKIGTGRENAAGTTGRQQGKCEFEIKFWGWKIE
jgi:hypothetical protein